MSPHDKSELTKLGRVRLSDRVAGELRRLMVQGTYPPGSKLPTGQQLAEQLGVTRLTVREALAQLETSGFIQTKHGSGTFVVDPAEHATLHMLAEALTAGRRMTAAEIRSLLAFRDVMVLGFIDDIARHVTREQLDQLDALLAEERAALGRPELLAGLDFRLNQVLAAASGNHFYALLLRSVKGAHLFLGEIVFAQTGDGSAVVATHAAMVKAAHQRDASALRRSIRAYLAGGTQLVTAWLRTHR